MRHIELKMRAAKVGADLAYDRISRFETYPDLVDEVRSVVVHQGSDGDHSESDWEVYFRNGPLRWSEADYFEPDRHRIVFEQTDGDFEVFRGLWAIEPAADGCAILFESSFDFGIPSLAGILEPIATKVLKEGIATVVARLLGGIVLVGDPAVQAAVAARLSGQPPDAESNAEKLQRI